MFFKLVIAFTFLLSFRSNSQCIRKPIFIWNDSISHQSINFNEYVEQNFKLKFFDYFEDTCGFYYDVVRFKFDSVNNIRDLVFSGPNSVMTRFLTDVLNSTKGHWNFTPCDKCDKCDNRASNKIGIVVPVYFYFMVRCNDIKQMIYYEKPIEKKYSPFIINGLKVVGYEKDDVILWPIKMRGIIVEESMKHPPTTE